MPEAVLVHKVPLSLALTRCFLHKYFYTSICKVTQSDTRVLFPNFFRPKISRRCPCLACVAPLVPLLEKKQK